MSSEREQEKLIKNLEKRVKEAQRLQIKSTESVNKISNELRKHKDNGNGSKTRRDSSGVRGQGSQERISETAYVQTQTPKRSSSRSGSKKRRSSLLSLFCGIRRRSRRRSSDNEMSYRRMQVHSQGVQTEDTESTARQRVPSRESLNSGTKQTPRSKPSTPPSSHSQRAHTDHGSLPPKSKMNIFTFTPTTQAHYAKQTRYQRPLSFTLYSDPDDRNESFYSELESPVPQPQPRRIAIRYRGEQADDDIQEVIDNLSVYPSDVRREVVNNLVRSGHDVNAYRDQPNRYRSETRGDRRYETDNRAYNVFFLSIIRMFLESIRKEDMVMNYEFIANEEHRLKMLQGYSWDLDLTNEGMFATGTNVIEYCERLQYAYTKPGLQDAKMYMLDLLKFKVFYGYWRNFPHLSNVPHIVKMTGLGYYQDVNTSCDLNEQDILLNRMYLFQVVNFDEESHPQFQEDLALCRRIRHPNILNLMYYNIPVNQNICINAYECPLLGSLKHFLPFVRDAMSRDEAFTSVYTGQLLMVYYYFNLIDKTLPELDVNKVYVNIHGYLKVTGPWRHLDTHVSQYKRYDYLYRLGYFAKLFTGDAVDDEDLFQSDEFENLRKFLKFLEARCDKQSVFHEAFESDLFRIFDFDQMFNQRYDLIDSFKIDREEIYVANYVKNIVF